MRILFDTDPGIDDAAAITVALHEPSIEIVLMTSVAGNVSLDKTTANAGRLLDFFHKDIPLAAGSPHPLLQEPFHAANVHGNTGMNGYDFPESSHPVLPVHAVNAMRDALLKEPLTLVAVGPLTNVALLLRMYPECREHIQKIVLMGGSTGRGNVSPYAEFNIYADPEAASVVFSSGLPIVMCGLNITSTATLSTADFDEIETFGRCGKMLASLFRFYHSACGGYEVRGAKIHDLCTIAYLTHPEFFVTETCSVEVALSGPARGATSVDFTKPGTVEACTALDADALRNWFKQTLERIG